MNDNLTVIICRAPPPGCVFRSYDVAPPAWRDEQGEIPGWEDYCAKCGLHAGFHE